MPHLKTFFLVLVFSLSLHADMFSEGSRSIGVKLGGASIGSEDYTIAGVSGNYFVLENLSVGLGYEKWFSGNPDIQKLTIESTYFIPASENFRPYVGLLLRRIIIGSSDRIGENYDDTNAYGYRAGLAFTQDRLLISVGVVQEKYDSTEGLFGDTETYAEVLVGFTF